MSNDSNASVPVYIEHEGTLRISGESMPRLIAQSVHTLISRDVQRIELFYIGGNAGQQATKAMTIVAYQVFHESGGKFNALFHPLRVLTATTDPNTGAVKQKDASVWLLVLVHSETLPVNFNAAVTANANGKA